MHYSVPCKRRTFSLYFDKMFILWRHILRVHVGPFIFSVLLLMGIFLLQYLMKYLDQLTGKGLSAAVIAELILLNLGMDARPCCANGRSNRNVDGIWRACLDQSDHCYEGKWCKPI